LWHLQLKWCFWIWTENSQGDCLLLLKWFLLLSALFVIEEKGDKDYAYSGLTLNLLFMLVYITSLIYFIFTPSN